MWARAVAASVAVLVVAGVALGVSWALSRETTIASFSVRGAASGVTLELRGGSVDVVGGGRRERVEVQRIDEHSFGHEPVTTRTLRGGVVALATRCPEAVLDSCDAHYRLVVPDNLPLTIRTTDGDVRFDRFRGSAGVTTDGGDVDVEGFCGFSLEVSARTGDVSAAAVCPTERLLLRSREGDVAAAVPPGRYRLDADTDGGARSVRGIEVDDEAPFQIQALSDGGDVEVTAQR